MNHHGTPIAASTDRSSVNSPGSTEEPSPNAAAKIPAANSEKRRHPPCHRLSVPGITGTQRGTDQRLRRNR